MKTYLSILKQITTIIIISFFLFTLSCSDDPSSPKKEDDNPTPQETVTIGVDGGTVEKGDFKITIPAGAFDGNYDIAVSEIEDDGAFGENTISTSFEIDGLPNEFNQPLKIEIRYGEEHTDDIFIAIGNEFYNEVYDSTSIIYDLYEAIDSSGFITADIPINNSNAFQKSAQTKNISVDNSKKFISVADFTRIYKTAHFKIKYPVFLSQNMVELGNTLESVYDIMVNDLEYLEDKYSNLPVVIKYQKKTVDYSLKNKDEISINISRVAITISSLDNFQNIKNDFFNIWFDIGINERYNTIYSKQWDKNNYTWMRFAFYTWAEKYLDTNPDFKYSTNFENNILAPFNGVQYAASSEKEIYMNHGYGMASFLEYLEKNTSFGKKGFQNTYKNITSELDPLTSMFNNVDGLFLEWFADYYKKLINNEVYELPKDYFIKNAKISWDINNENDTVKIFNAQDEKVDTYLDLSAKLFKINLNYKPIDESYKMRLTMQGPVSQFGLYLHVWGIQNNELYYLGSVSGLYYYEIPNLKEYYDNNMNQFLVCVVNGLGNSPYIGESDIDLKVQVGNNFDGGGGQSDLDYNLCRIEVYLQGLVEDTRWAEGTQVEYPTGVGTSHDYYDYEDTVRTISGSFYGNVFTGSFNDGEGWTQNATITLSEDQKTIIDYSFEEIFEKWGDKTIRKVSGSNIPISNSKNTLFEIYGENSCSSVFEIQNMTIENETDTSKVVDFWCNENSRVIIQFYKN